MKRKMRLCTILYALTLTCWAQDPVILSSESLNNTVDATAIGQSFTITQSITLSSVGVWVKKIAGGAPFELSVQPYDPWNNAQGEAVFSATVPASGIPDGSGGGWVEVPISPPLQISNPGIYSILADTDSQGFPDGYNEYGVALGDSIQGGVRFTGGHGPIVTELVFRMRGSAPPGAFTPPLPSVPKISGPIVEDYYEFAVRAMRKRFTYTWDTEVDVVYIVENSKDMSLWFDDAYLGTGAQMSATIRNTFWDTQYLRVTAKLLGDYRK
ncbi:hypothetical protein JIN85_20305 [Luteolibacter pohnpeiensis]|uniref:Uncharacterized protein n=1 Tax=Luteolibacter pohnpeiensis TaxID=454153 RepID=A0A934VSW9_9BACT|nr:hypothetical protein [Luteolibacter pohnpeiensis]MBK1884766.1 hypothetical protein [Luteolibacter pohnpeiensis]